MESEHFSLARTAYTKVLARPETNVAEALLATGLAAQLDGYRELERRIEELEKESNFGKNRWV